MHWIYDNLVLLALAVSLVAIVVSLVVVAVSGLRLYRAGRASMASAGAAGAALAADIERLTAAVEALPERQAELQREIIELQARSAALRVLATRAGELVALVRAPLGQRIR